MRSILSPLAGPRRLLAVVALLVAGTAPAAHAAALSFMADLDGASESPPVASAGTGFAQVDIDAEAHTMHILVAFSGLTGTTTAAHIHAATAMAGTGTSSVATTTPTFAGFPLGVTAGTYEVTLDMTQTSSYSPAFITNHGGTTALAEAFLFQSIVEGTAYFNIHSTFAGGGEIRGFLEPLTVPADAATWGETKALYR